MATPVSVATGGRTVLDLRLERATVLVGRVSRADGGSVERVQVQVATRGAWDCVTGEVAADGTFRAGGLGAGRWRVLLRPFEAIDGVYLSQNLRGRAVVDEANRRGTIVDLPPTC